MTNAVNVEFIVEKLLSFLATATDDHFRTDLVGQITQCAERFAPSNAWYVQTIIRVFELAGDKVKASVAQTLTQLIAEGSEVEEEEEEEEREEGDLSADDELRTEAVENFLDLMVKPKLPEILAQAVAWVLGEYGFLSTSCSMEQIMEKLCTLTTQCTDPLTKAHVISAISKLVAQNGACPSKVFAFMERYARSVSLDVQQRCVEFKVLLKDPNTLVEVLPVDASCEDIEIDEDLTFLQGYVDAALQAGAKPYSPPQNYEEDDVSIDSQQSKLKITPYAVPTLPAAQTNGMIVGAAGPLGGPSSMGATVPNAFGGAPMSALTSQSIANAQGNQLLGVAKSANQVWGKKPEPPPPMPQAAAAPPSPMSASGSSANSFPAHVSGPYGNQSGSAPSSSGAGAGAGGGGVQNPVQQAPRELSEKEKQAAALFGGLSGGPSASRASKPVQRRGSALNNASSRTAPIAAATPDSTPSVASQPEPAHSEPVPQPAPAVVTTPAPTPAPAPSPAPAPEVELLDLDLLDMHSPPSAPIPLHVPVAATPATPTPAVLPKQALPPTPPAAPAAPAVNTISDAFAGFMMDNASPSGSSTTVAEGSANVMPLVIVTAEFGKRWGSTPFDVKTSIPCAANNITSLEQLRRAIPPSYHHVESIPATQEAIYAATITSTGSVILVHVKLHAARKQADVVVKSNSKEVCAKEAAFLSSSIAAFR